MAKTHGTSKHGLRASRPPPALATALAVASLISVITAGPLAASELRPSSAALAGFRHASDDPAIAAEPSPPHASQHLFVVCPVDPPLHYTDDFGEPRYVGGFHLHQGIDVFAQRGTPIRAPFDGTAKESLNWAGGLAVYVYGASGFVYNAHLSKLGKLGPVKGGDVVGYVGNSGDAMGGSTHDHFEWHPGGGPAVDPIVYFNQTCRGRPPAPPLERDLKLA